MKILIRLPNWLGDVVMSTAFIGAVGRLYPGAVVDIIIKKELGGIAGLIPGIHNIHLFAKQEHSGLAGVYRFGKTLRAHRYDIFFNLPHSLSSFIMAWASGARQRVGFRKEGGIFLMSRSYKKPVNLHRVDEYLYLLKKFTGKTGLISDFGFQIPDSSLISDFGFRISDLNKTQNPLISDFGFQIPDLNKTQNPLISDFGFRISDLNKTQTPNPSPQTPNQNTETPAPKPQTPNPEPEVRNPKFKIRNPNTLIINFNSEASSRRMPLGKGREIISTLIRTFTGARFVFIGSGKEAAFVDELIIGLPGSDRLENHAGRTDLAGLAGLMAGSKAVLTTDSGPAHLANAVGVPTVVLFGAGNEDNTAPYNKKNLAVLRYGKLSCEPCVKNTCRLYGIPRCMQMLDEMAIINALSLHLNDA